MKNIRLVLVLISIGFTLFFCDALKESRKRENVYSFLDSNIILFNDLKSENNIQLETDFASCFSDLIKKSIETRDDFNRGEKSKIISFKLINDKDNYYQVTLVYSDYSDIYRVKFYDDKNLIQFNYYKSIYFDNLIELANNYLK